MYNAPSPRLIKEKLEVSYYDDATFMKSPKCLFAWIRDRRPPG